MSHPSRFRTRLGAAAGLLGVAAALTAATGVGPAPSIFQLAGANEDVRGNCDEAEHANDPACAGTLIARADRSDDPTTSTTGDDRTTTAPPAGAPASGEVRTVSAGDAGSIMVTVEGAQLRLLTASPNQGWQVEVEQAAGREVEVSFRSGVLRVDVNVELEDGQIRERVRTRNDATDARTETENGVTVSDDSDDSGHGSDDDSADDDSNDADDTDDDGSGSGSDDSSDHGSDDGPDHD
ncbi:MAG: hypothetical protein ACT452_18060 [Microthrixaceae bacterium]